MDQINNKNLVAYSLLAFCLAFVGLPIYIYLPNYYHNNFAISLQSMSMILLATRLVDTIQDPLIGIFSDKFAYLRKKIICFVSPFLGISFLLLFYPFNAVNIQLWLIVTLIVTYSLFSIVYINYQAYAVSLSYDYHIKTRIVSYREIAFIFGIIFAASVPAMLFTNFSEPDSFFIIGIFYCFLISVFALIFWRFGPESVARVQNLVSYKIIWQNSSLRNYFKMFFFNSISSSVPAVLMIFFVEEIIDAKAQLGLFLLLYFFGLLLGVVVWTKLSKLLDSKVKALLLSTIFTIIVFPACYLLGRGDVLFYALICVLSGLGFGGDFVLSYSILTDLLQKYNLQNSESLVFGLVNFIIKISLTISSVILLYVVGSLEFDVEAKKQFISFSYAIIPIVFRVFAVNILYKKFCC